MLDSLEAQSRVPDEVILVDNNSSDNSPDLMTRWAAKMNSKGWKVRVIAETRPGAAAARKAGEALISSRYAAFFDSDDIMHPDFLEAAMRDFEADPDLKFTVWNLNFRNPDGSVTRRRLIPSRPLENHLIQGLLSTQAYAVATDYLISVGGWNPEIGGWDDWELGLRLLLGGGKFKITDTPRAEVTVQENSISGLSYLHRKGDWENTINTMEKFLLSLPREKNRFPLRLLAYRRAILAAHYRHEGDRPAARQLLKRALDSDFLNPFHRLILRTAYCFTSTGIAGAGAIFPPLLRL